MLIACPATAAVTRISSKPTALKVSQRARGNVVASRPRLASESQRAESNAMRGHHPVPWTIAGTPAEPAHRGTNADQERYRAGEANHEAERARG